MVRRLRGGLQFHVDLIEQLLGLLGVAAEVKFVRSLSGRDSFPCLMGQTLGRGEIGMTTGADVPYRRIRIRHRASNDCNDNQSG